MIVCKGCGAFITTKCPYCGYEAGESVGETKYNDKKYVTLVVSGKMNNINVVYGECTKERIVVDGKMNNSTITAEFLNIELSGKMNNITIDKKVKFFDNVTGKMNNINVKTSWFR